RERLASVIPCGRGSADRGPNCHQVLSTFLMSMMSPLSSIVNDESNGMEHWVVAHLDEKRIRPCRQAVGVEIVDIALVDMAERIVCIRSAFGVGSVRLAVRANERDRRNCQISRRQIVARSIGHFKSDRKFCSGANWPGSVGVFFDGISYLKRPGAVAPL